MFRVGRALCPPFLVVLFESLGEDRIEPCDSSSKRAPLRTGMRTPHSRLRFGSTQLPRKWHYGRFISKDRHWIEPGGALCDDVFVERIEGSISHVVVVPMEPVTSMLDE